MLNFRFFIESKSCFATYLPIIYLQDMGFLLTSNLLKTNFMGNLGFQEILLIAVVVLVLFGGRKIPEFMRGLGKGIREFNDAKSNVKKELEEGMKEKDQTTTTTTTPQP
jgi:sec-independent protein translocase protein TatA